MGEFCEVNKIGRLTEVTINRPEVMNALHPPANFELAEVFDEFAADPDQWVAIITGAGDRAFSAGNDLKYQASGGQMGGPASGFAGLTARFDNVKPVIAAVNGLAMGGGFEIALCCDILLVSETAQLGLPEGRLGLSPGGGGTQRLVRAVGKYAASDLMLAGWRMSGQRAFELGIAAEVTDDLDTAVLQRARGCLKIAPLAQAEMKRLMREGFDAPIETAKSYEQEVLFRLYSTADGQEGIDAFLEKRAPEFRGV